ncbi:MAG: PKD repeat protein [Glaciecola sp.]|jgi:PKD repeat protein
MESELGVSQLFSLKLIDFTEDYIMKFTKLSALCVCIIIIFQGVAMATDIDEPAISLQLAPGEHLTAGGSESMNGYEFTPTENVTVTALGVYDLAGCTFRPAPCADGLLDAHEVGIWTDTGNLLAAATVPAGISGERIGQFRYINIVSQELTAGQSYIVASLNPARDYTIDDGFVLGPNGTSANYTFDSRIAFVQGRRKVGGFQYPDTVTTINPFLGGSLLLEPARPNLPALTLQLAPGEHLTAGGSESMNGYEFTPTENVTVTALGVYDLAGCTFRPAPCADGLLDAHEVGIWTDTGNLLAAATVPAGISGERIGQFRYINIVSQELTAGQSYIVASLNPARDYTIDDGFVLGPNGTSANYTFDSRIAFVQGRRKVGGFQYPDTVTTINPFLGGSLLLRGEISLPVPPTADAGINQAIHAGYSVLLDGSGSFDDNTPIIDLDYAWNFLSTPFGSNAALIDADTVSPSFTADLSGTYIVQLVVTDEDALSDSSTVEISSENLAPQALVGSNQLVLVGALVQLDGSSSFDPDEDMLEFDWTISSVPSGSNATINDASSAIANFVPDLEGLYVLNLAVSDYIGSGIPAIVQVTATLAEEFAEVQIINVDTIITALDKSEVTTVGNQEAYGNFLSQASIAIQTGDIVMAIDKLEKAITRTDGCAIRGEVDGKGQDRDWVTDCAQQAQIYPALVAALEALLP